MFSLYSKKYNYIMHCVPKSGCTYLRHLFLQLHDDESFGSSITKFNASLLANNLADSDISTLQSVLILRNPYHRLVSGWVDKIVIRPTENIKKILIPEFESYLGQKLFLDATLEDFCSFLLSRIKGQLIDQHFSLQVPLSWRYKPSSIIDLGCVDDGLSVFYQKINKELLEKYLSVIKNKHERNKSPYNSVEEYPLKPFSAATLSVDHLFGLAQMKLLPPSDYFFNEQVIASVSEIYQNDLLYLEFDKPDIIIKANDVANIEKMLATAWVSRHPVLHRGQLPEDFCSICYDKLNPDISVAGVDLIEHYVSSGIFEKNRKYKEPINNGKYCIHQIDSLKKNE